MKNIIIKSLREKQKDISKATENFLQKPKYEMEEVSEKSYEPTNTRKIINFLLFSIFVLTVGGIGGILIDRFALPYVLVKYPELNKYEFLKKVNERTTIIEITKEVKISEDRAVIDAIKKVSPSIVQISKPLGKNEGFEYNRTGVIFTSDGLILTLNENQTQESSSKTKEEKTVKVKLENEKIYIARIIGTDEKSGLSLIKIEESNLPVVAFSNSDNIELGEKLILISNSIETEIVSEIIEKNKNTEKTIKISGSFGELFSGSPSINIKGEIAGINQKENLIIPINEAKKIADAILNENL